MQVKEATKQIKLNSLDLTLRDVKVTLASGDTVLPASTEISTPNEMVTLTFDKALPIGKAKLSMAFNGELNDKMKGLYRSKYTSWVVFFVCVMIAFDSEDVEVMKESKIYKHLAKIWLECRILHTYIFATFSCRN